MQDRSPHKGQLPQLREGDLLDGRGVGDNARVRHQDARDIGPVFVHVGLDRRGGDGSGDIAPSAGHHAKPSGGELSVKAWNHDPAVFFHRFGDGRIRGLPVQRSVQSEEDAVRRVDEGIVQIGCHQLGSKILASGHDLVHGGVFVEFALKLLQFSRDVHRDLQFVADLQQTRLHRSQDLFTGHAVGQMCMDQIQQVRQLMIISVSLSGGGNDNHPSAIIRLDDGFDLAKLLRAGNGGSSEFCYLQHLRPPSPRQRRSPCRPCAVRRHSHAFSAR